MGYPVFYQGEIHISPTLTAEHKAVVSDFLRLARTAKTTSLFASIAASSESGLPDYSGLLEVSITRSFLFPQEGESRAGVLLWLTLLSEHFFGPMGYQLNGQVFWEGSEPEDRGRIFVKANQVEAVNDLIVNAGPSWSPKHYADEHLKRLLEQLVVSSDDTGCSPDLTVVESDPVESIRAVVSRL